MIFGFVRKRRGRSASSPRSNGRPQLGIPTGGEIRHAKRLRPDSVKGEMLRKDILVGGHYAYSPWGYRFTQVEVLDTSSRAVQVRELDGERRELLVAPRDLRCRWEDLDAWRAAQEAKKQSREDEQAELQRQGVYIAQRLKEMGFKQNSISGFRVKRVTRGNKSQPQFVVCWEILAQLLAGQQSPSGSSALDGLLGGVED